jgi:seryl-tRNA synthetase|tara:strand:- start:382 stop:609 length:228 start_codon:yes stop_codon:yes gene_type:complete
MPEEMKQEEMKIVLENGKEVSFSDLSDEQKILVNHLRDLDMKMGRMNFEAQQLQAAKNAFSKELNDSFEEVEEDA